jgi:hypothetical protein
MWINPNHPNPPRQADAPRENGDRLVTFERHGGEELRVSLAEFNGHPFVSLRVWAPGQDGQLWPVRGKGISVKLREVAGLAEALAAVAGQLGDGTPNGRGDRKAESLADAVGSAIRDVERSGSRSPRPRSEQQP